MGIKETNICKCKADKQPKGDTFFAPLKGKMKVLKKIKRRMGLASRSSSHGGGTNNLPPLLFHHVHGENIRISRDGTVAKRVESFCKGIAFSSRPVKVNEKVCIKFLEISNNWSGVIRFGFTSNDPTGLRYDLPKYACPDLTNKPGYWAKALPERFCAQGAVLFYYVTATGDVHFGINGEEKGVFFGNVETRGPLWCLIDVYGNSTAIEFVDVRHQLNNSNRYNSTGNCEVFRPDPVERITYPMQQMAIQPNEELSLPLLRYQPPHLNYQAMALHRTRGRNVRFMNGNRSVAYRTDTEFCQGYVFTSRPLQIGERMVVQILGTEPMFQGCLGLGLTSCDPALLTAADLPDDSNCLLDRPEYWVVSRDIARHLHKGDEVSFCVSAEGEVRIGRNGCPPTIVIHVDHTLRLYAFFDIYGSTQRIRVLSCPAPQQAVPHGGVAVGAVSPHRNPERRIISPVTPSSAASESMNSINAQSEQLRRQQQQQQQVAVQPPAPTPATPAQPVMCVTPADIQVQPGANGGAVLSVILPPIIQQQTNGHHHNGHVVPPTTAYQAGPVAAQQQAAGPGGMPPTGTMVSVCSSNYVEPLSDSSAYSTPLPWSEAVAALPPTSMSAPGVPPPPGAECTICYEQPIDAVLYMCGHMCMCYECALQQWRGKGGGHCPLCRAVIRDVIRTYKS